MESNHFFPIFLDISDKVFVIAGGGSVAARKAASLKKYTDQIIVIAEETNIPDVKCIRKKLDLDDLCIADYVIAATSDASLNREIASYCREHDLPVNVVDDPALCTFLFPSMIQRGDLELAISTRGASPAFSKKMRKSIEQTIPTHTEQILEEMRRLRKELPHLISDQKSRAACYNELLDALFDFDRDPADPNWKTECESIIRSHCPDTK